MQQIVWHVLFLFVLVFFAIPKQVYSVTTTLNPPPSVESNDPFLVNITVAGAGSGTNYLRIDLYKPETTNYFGETFNGTDWYNESLYTKYFAINVQQGSDWTGQIQARFGSPNSSQYDTGGTYKLRARRYTSSGSFNSTEANNSAVDINITMPVPSPTAIPTTLSETPSPTDTSDNTSPPPVQETPLQSYTNLFIS